jgi:hypothetical protein
MATEKKTTVKTKTTATLPTRPSADNTVATKNMVNKPMAKPAAKAPTPKKAAVKKLPLKPATEKSVKTKKPKLVRDSFTIPKAEYAVLEELKQRAAQLARPIKKSELIRASIKVLASLSGAAFLTALNQVPVIKTGRPSAKK